MVETQRKLPKIALIYPSKSELGTKLLEGLAEEPLSKFDNQSPVWKIETKYYTAEVEFVQFPYDQ